MYKLVVLDMDGTLLTTEKTISEYTSNVIKDIKDKVKIVLASARGFNTIKPYLEQINTLDSENYTIAFNGSLILKNSEDKIWDNAINEHEKVLIEEYIKKFENLEWYYYIYEKRVNRKQIDNIEDFVRENTIYKIVCISDENKIKNMRNEISEKIHNSFQITSSEPTRIEFVKKGMTKIKAIQKIMDTLKITPDEVIAIGDGENDLDMINFAGFGVAMGNATKEVKEIAQYITDTNDNNGVAKALEKLV